MVILERMGVKLSWSGAAGFLGFGSALGGQLKQAFALFDRAFEAADQADIPGSGHAVANLAGFCCEWLGDPRAARGWFDREFNRPRNSRSLWARRELSDAIAFTYYHEGQIDELQRRLGSENMAGRYWSGGGCESIAALLVTTGSTPDRARNGK